MERAAENTRQGVLTPASWSALTTAGLITARIAAAASASVNARGYVDSATVALRIANSDAELAAASTDDMSRRPYFVSYAARHSGWTTSGYSAYLSSSARSAFPVVSCHTSSFSSALCLSLSSSCDTDVAAAAAVTGALSSVSMSSSTRETVKDMLTIRAISAWTLAYDKAMPPPPLLLLLFPFGRSTALAARVRFCSSIAATVPSRAAISSVVVLPVVTVSISRRTLISSRVRPSRSSAARSLSADLAAGSVGGGTSRLTFARPSSAHAAPSVRFSPRTYAGTSCSARLSSLHTSSSEGVALTTPWSCSSKMATSSSATPAALLFPSKISSMISARR